MENKTKCSKCGVSLEGSPSLYAGVAVRRPSCFAPNDLLLMVWCLKCGPTAKDNEGNRAKYLDPQQEEGDSDYIM